MNHRKAIKYHAAKRLKERHGIVSSDGKVVEHVKRMIQTRTNARKVRCQNLRRRLHSVWVLHIGEKYVPIVYDELRNNVVTALPVEFLDNIDSRLYRIEA